mmetsp:Transcript_63207/g.150740  ORF Transcript_63207/g.150740 Transcript_63207/m.150740 type:complete len:419 (+) Transcript_63207:113-1369(+)
MGITVDEHAVVKAGSGAFGAWTAKDDFVTRRRRTKWCRCAEDETSPKHKPLPRLYVDNQTIIREVTDICSLRKGDHCLIAINLVRSLSPMIDYLVSFLGSVELIYFYHHFIMVDDVAEVDEQGIPRTKDGHLAEIVEYGNTIPQAAAELRSKTSGRWTLVPGVAARFMLDKSKCQRMALADYGDTRHIYVVVANRSAEEREAIVGTALGKVQDHKPYHFIFNNCEHLSNVVTRGRFTSPMVNFVLWNLLRVVLCCMGIQCLGLTLGACSRYRADKGIEISALWGYHLLTSVPVMLQACISFWIVARSVWRQYARESVISRDDCLHLLSKEFGRMVVAGGLAAATISRVPAMATKPQDLAVACLVCFFAYAGSDLLYNCLAHAVMRLVLLPVWGRVWLLDDGTGAAQVVEDISLKSKQS